MRHHTDMKPTYDQKPEAFFKFYDSCIICFAVVASTNILILLASASHTLFLHFVHTGRQTDSHRNQGNIQKHKQN